MVNGNFLGLNMFVYWESRSIHQFLLKMIWCSFNLFSWINWINNKFLPSRENKCFVGTQCVCEAAGENTHGKIQENKSTSNYAVRLIKLFFKFAMLNRKEKQWEVKFRYSRSTHCIWSHHATTDKQICYVRLLVKRMITSIRVADYTSRNHLHHRDTIRRYFILNIEIFLYSMYWEE